MKEEHTDSPVTTRSGTSLGRNLFKLVAPYLSPTDPTEQDKKIQIKSIESSDDKVKPDAPENEKENASDDMQLDKVLAKKPLTPVANTSDLGSDESAMSGSDMFHLNISNRVYEDSDSEWPIREAIIFR